MGSEQVTKTSMAQFFSDFMARITKFEELVDVGSRFLVGFQQGLDFLRRPPIDTTSDLVGQIIKANETLRLSSYIQAGCINTHDRKQCLSTSKCVVKELECLLADAATVVQTSVENLQDKGVDGDLDSYTDEELPSADLQKPKITDYATLMAVIYGMVKEDYKMQEKIVSSLNLKSTSGELESYCLMWSLRPFVDDEIMQKAWRVVR